MQSPRLFSIATLLFSFVTLVVGQNLHFVSPTKDTVIKPGEKITLKLKFDSISPSVKQIAWTLGLNGFKNDETSLGRPVIDHLGIEAIGAEYKSNEKTYYWNITIPTVDQFLEGFNKPYRLTLSQYYVDVNDFEPNTHLISVPVTLMKA